MKAKSRVQNELFPFGFIQPRWLKRLGLCAGTELPAEDEAKFEFAVDEKAEQGNILPALADLLIGLATGR